MPVLVLQMHQWRVWREKVFASIGYIGKYSYGIYCFHQIVINCALMLMLKDNNLLLWFATFALIAVVSCGAGIGGELIEENNTKSKDSFENKTTYKKKKWFNSPSGFNKRNSSSAKIK